MPQRHPPVSHRSRVVAPAVAALLLLATIAAVPSSWAQKKPPPAGLALFERALQATKAGNDAEAERLYHALLKNNPEAAAAWANLGLLAARNNRAREGVGYLQKATRLEPKNTAFQVQLSGVQLKAGKPADAAASARKALARDPKNDAALANLSAALMQQRRFAEAALILRRLQSGRGGSGGDLQTGRGLILALSRSGRKREARETAQKMAAAFPKDVTTHLMVGDLSGQIGDYAAAASAYRRALTLDPKNARAGINAAISTEMAGRRAEAVALFQKLAVTFPDNPQMPFHLGRLYYKDESIPPAARFQKAEGAFRAAMLLDPKNTLYLGNLGLALMFQGTTRHEEAVKVFEAALYLEPKSVIARMGLGYVAEEAKKPDEAMDHYRTILASAPNEHQARRRLAGLLYVTGKKDEAYREFEEIITRNPKDLTTLAEAASLLASDKRRDDAKKMYARMISRDPKAIRAYMGLAQILEDERNSAGARGLYEAAIRAAPGKQSAMAYFALAGAYQRDKKPEQAVTVYRSLLAADPGNHLARWQLAQIYQTLNRDTDALREMRALKPQKSDPNRIGYLLGPANLLGTRGRHAEATAELEKLHKAEPGEVNIAYALADALDRVNRAAEADALLRQIAAKAKPDDLRPHIALGHLAERRERLDEAAQHYETALRRDPNRNEARFGLRRVRERQKQPEAAMTFLENLAISDPAKPNMAAVGSLATLYGADKTPEKYMAFIRRVAEKYPKDRAALQAYADAALQQANPPPASAREIALGVYRQMLANDANDNDARYRLAGQLEMLGRRDEAIATYRDVLKAAAGPNDPFSSLTVDALRRMGAPVLAAASNGGGSGATPPPPLPATGAEKKGP